MANGNTLEKPNSNPKSVGAIMNRDCGICRKLGFMPFRQCNSCTVAKAWHCPPLGMGIVLLWAAALVAGAILAPARVGEVAFYAGVCAVLGLLFTLNSRDERARTHRRLEAMQKELAEQHNVLKDLAPLASMDECLQHVVQAAAQRLRCDQASLLLADEAQQKLTVAAARGMPVKDIRNKHVPIGRVGAGLAFQSDETVHIEGAGTMDATAGLSAGACGFLSGPAMLAGIRWGGTRLGVLGVACPRDRKGFTVDDEFLFRNICEAAAAGVYNHRTLDQLRKTNVEFLETLVHALEARDVFTSGHSERVWLYARAIGSRMGLDSQTLANLRMGCLLHDVGKIGLSDEILSHRTTASEAEWQQIRKHPLIAAEMLAGASVVSSAMEAIKYHHERLDGSGYPEGLEGEQVPMAARIVGLADAFDAMTTRSRHRNPFTVTEAMREVRRDSGAKFDPDCVTALGEAIKSGELDAVLPADPTKDHFAEPVAAGAR